MIDYTITITNTGNVTVSDITLAGSNIDPGSISCTTPFNLNPGASTTCTATHTLTQADIDAGEVVNVACGGSYSVRPRRRPRNQGSQRLR